MVKYKNVLLFQPIIFILPIATTENVYKTVWKNSFGEDKDVIKTQKQMISFSSEISKLIR